MNQRFDYDPAGGIMTLGAPSGYPVPHDHRQFDSIWNAFGGDNEDFEEFGLMDNGCSLTSDFDALGSCTMQQHQHFDLQISDALNDFAPLNVDEIVSHDTFSRRTSFCTQSSLQEMVPSSSEVRSMVPSSSPYAGDFGFQVAVEKQLKTTKSASWVFFDRISKLFVMRDKQCPFLFRTSQPPPPHSIIRVLPIYPTADHVTEIVTRCPTHACERRNQEDPQLARHLIISEHQLAEHVQDSYSNRLNVIIPYENPQVGAEWVTSLFQFKCLGSCQKINDRRSWQVIFTLECNGMVLGRQVILVHCCSSPGRDGLREEQKRFGIAVPAQKKNLVKNGIATSVLQKSLVFAPKPSNDVYRLQIRGKERFEMLLKIRDALHMSSNVNQSSFNEFRQKLRQMDERVNAESQRERGVASKKSVSGRDISSEKPKKRRHDPISSKQDTIVKCGDVFQHQPLNV